MQVCRMCLSHNIRHQNASIAVMMIISVKYKNITNPNSLPKRITNHLWLWRMHKTFLYSHWISVYLLLKLDKIQFFKDTYKFGVLFYEVSRHLYLLQMCISQGSVQDQIFMYF